MNIKKIPRIDKINDAKSHIVKFSFKISKVKRIAQIVLDPDLAATAASGKINENALSVSVISSVPIVAVRTIENLNLRENAARSN